MKGVVGGEGALHRCAAPARVALAENLKQGGRYQLGWCGGHNASPLTDPHPGTK
jgi:hypothetical protein